MLTLAALLFTATSVDWDAQTYKNAKREAERVGKPLIVWVGANNPPDSESLNGLDAILCWVERLNGFEEPCVLVLPVKAAYAWKLWPRASRKEIEAALTPAKAEPKGAPSRTVPRGC